MFGIIETLKDVLFLSFNNKTNLIRQLNFYCTVLIHISNSCIFITYQLWKSTIKINNCLPIKLWLYIIKHKIKFN